MHQYVDVMLVLGCSSAAIPPCIISFGSCLPDRYGLEPVFQTTDDTLKLRGQLINEAYLDNVSNKLMRCKSSLESFSWEGEVIENLFLSFPTKVPQKAIVTIALNSRLYHDLRLALTKTTSAWVCFLSFVGSP